MTSIQRLARRRMKIVARLMRRNVAIIGAFEAAEFTIAGNHDRSDLFEGVPTFS